MKKWSLKNGVVQYKKMCNDNVEVIITPLASPLFALGTAL